MQWDNKNKNGRAGMVLLCVGLVILALAVALTMTFGTIWSPVMLVTSMIINTAAIIILRGKR